MSHHTNDRKCERDGAGRIFCDTEGIGDDGVGDGNRNGRVDGDEDGVGGGDGDGDGDGDWDGDGDGNFNVGRFWQTVLHTRPTFFESAPAPHILLMHLIPALLVLCIPGVPILIP